MWALALLALWLVGLVFVVGVVRTRDDREEELLQQLSTELRSRGAERNPAPLVVMDLQGDSRTPVRTSRRWGWLRGGRNLEPVRRSGS
jgi:hypothetical protein